MTVPTEGGGGERRGVASASLVFGVILILLGILFLAGQVLRIDVGALIWPFFIIAPGVALFVLALVTRGAASEPLAYVGSLVTMVGLILLYQNTTGHWQSWAYAWALVAPTSIGLGQIIYGTFKSRQELVKAGLRVAAIGGAMFLVGIVFFELIIGISGFGLGPVGWPLLLIGLGVLLLVASLWRGFKPR